MRPFRLSGSLRVVNADDKVTVIEFPTHPNGVGKFVSGSNGRWYLRDLYKQLKQAAS